MIINLHAHFHSDSALYPDSGFQSDSGLSQGGTDSGLHPHSCLHPDSGFYSPHSYFHVIIISAYPAVLVKKLTICWQSLQACNYAKGRNKCRNNANDSFRKGFHVLNHLMTGRCPRKSLKLRPKFHSFFLQNSFNFQKSATFEGLKSSPRMY